MIGQMFRRVPEAWPACPQKLLRSNMNSGSTISDRPDAGMNQAILLPAIVYLVIISAVNIRRTKAAALARLP